MTLLLCVGPLEAMEFQCQRPGDTRFIRVDVPGEESLCDVAVTYQQSGEKRILWFAQNSTGYCLDRARELREKYTEEWQFECSSLPDHDGIDQLGERQREVFDQSLRALLDRSSNWPESIRTLSSPGGDTLAVQYFYNTETAANTGIEDHTDFLNVSDDSWQQISSIDNLADRLPVEAPVEMALIADLTDDQSLTVLTAVVPSTKATDLLCRGEQVLSANTDTGQLVALTPHRFICSASR